MTNPVPSTPTPAPKAQSLSAEAQTLLTQFKAVDPAQSSVGLDKIRIFYPRVGWNVIFARIHELEAAGKLTKKAVLNPRGGVGYHLYTWKDA